jgi:uncharacterized protein
VLIPLLQELPHPTDSVRSDRLLVTALALWLAYYCPLVVLRAAFALALVGDPVAELPPGIHFVPTAICHAASLCVAWLVLTRGGRRSVLGFIREDWAAARGLLARSGRNFRNVDAFALYVGVGFFWWLMLTAVATMLPRPTGPTAFNSAATATLQSRLLVFALATFTAPVIEELYYRGFLLTQLRLAASRVLPVLLVTVLFAAQHIGQYRDAAGIISWQSVCYVAASGLVFALTRLLTGSLSAAIIVHATMNAINTGLIELVIRPLVKAS